MKKILKTLYLILSFLLGIGALLLYLSSHKLLWDKPLFITLNLFSPIILLGFIVFVVGAFIFKIKCKPILLLFLILSYQNYSKHFHIFFGNKEASKNHLSIGTLNSHEFKNAQSLDTKENILLETLNLDLDVLCIQEARIKGQNDLKQLQRDFPQFKFAFLSNHQLKKKQEMTGLLFISKYNIIHKQWLDLQQFGFGYAAQIEIEVDQKNISIYSFHLQSSSTSFRVLKQLTLQNGLDNPENKQKIGFSYFNLKRTSQIRAKQIDALRHIINKDKNSYLIICGDLNDLPTSFHYKNLKQNLIDAYQLQGTMFNNTTYRDLPFYRIDYLFHSQNLETTHYNRSKKVLSDHELIYCHLNFKE